MDDEVDGRQLAAAIDTIRQWQTQRERAVLVIQRGWFTYQLAQIDRSAERLAWQRRTIDLALGAIAERKAARQLVAQELAPEAARLEFAAITIQRGWTAHKLHQANRAVEAARLAVRQAFNPQVFEQAEIGGWVERAHAADNAFKLAESSRPP